MRSMIHPAKSFDDVYRNFEWKIPVRFNMGVAACDYWAKEDPRRIALKAWNGKELGLETSFGELKSISDRLANALEGLGLERGDRVAIILPQSLETAASHIAIYKAGAIAVPLARLFAADALQFRLKRSGASMVITNRDGVEKLLQVRDALPDLREIILIDGDDGGFGHVHNWHDLVERADTGYQPRDTDPDDPALIIFTSGTTGQPKGALHGHRVLLGHVPGVQVHHEYMPQPGDIAWTPADWAWAGGLLNVLMPCLYLGVPVVYGGLERFDPELAFEVLERANVTCAFIPPTAMRLMKTVEDAGERFDLSLRTIGSGGESLGAETYLWAKRELGITINEFYGQTECNLVLSAFGKLGVSREGSIGKAVPGHVVAVLDQAGNVCDPGVVGEVAIKRPDPVMFLEYWQDEEATKAKFRGDWMMTGDQAMVDQDGYFHFVGRDDDIINSAGYRVGPGEIEDCLISHPAVRLAAAVAKPDALRSEIVKAYVVLRDEAREALRGDNEGKAEAMLVEEIRQHVKSRMAANIYPREIEFVDDIPLTTTGKVIRRHFRDLARQEAETDGQSG